jgi:hypothetical protein
MLQLHLLGYGDLFGFDRVLEMSIDTEVHTGPRSPGDPVQLFPAKIHMIQGEIVGDPDFTLLRIQGGPAFGLLSSGETLLTQLPDGNWNVESLFEFSYQIEYQGAPGGVFAGLAGTSTQVAKMRAGEPVWFGNPCEVPDNGTGTATLPPAGCDYLDAEDVHVIASGLPPGTTIELDAIHRNFTCGNPLLTCTAFLPGGVCEGPGGSLGGNIDCFQSDAELTIKGTGALAGFQRTITFPLDTEVHTGPRNPGDSIQSFPSEMFRLQGEIFGDPDFCTLRIRAGSQLGLPSPGHTTLTDNGNGTFAVASLFDVQYEIDFLGCPGSILEGFGGTASGTIRMFVGESSLPPLPPQMVPGPSATVWMWLGALTLGTTAIVLLRRRGQAL